jgi:predicted site-specific integrase-resolvase
MMLIQKKEIVYDTVASLRRELGISDRTINRWALDGKIHHTKSLKYPLIKIIIKR